MVNLLVHLDKGGEGSMRWINVSLMIVSMARNMVKSPMWISSPFFLFGYLFGWDICCFQGLPGCAPPALGMNLLVE
jgi:hypothetical protein